MADEAEVTEETEEEGAKGGKKGLIMAAASSPLLAG